MVQWGGCGKTAVAKSNSQWLLEGEVVVWMRKRVRGMMCRSCVCGEGGWRGGQGG